MTLLKRMTKERFDKLKIQAQLGCAYGPATIGELLDEIEALKAEVESLRERKDGAYLEHVRENQKLRERIDTLRGVLRTVKIAADALMLGGLSRLVTEALEDDTETK